MSTLPEINQRDLRLRSKEIMDAVEAGQTFAVTRDGREIAELVPVRHQRRFVPRADFFTGGQRARIDLDRFRADLDSVIDPVTDDPFARHA